MYFIELLIKDNIINNIDDIPKTIRQSIFKKYKLTTLQSRFGVYNLFNILYPNKWCEWEFCRVKNNFWNDKDNLLNLHNWLINKLYSDNIINSIEDIVYLDNNIFKNYNLSGLLMGKFDDSPFKFWNYFYPNRWFEWEFKNTPKNYWNNKNNRIKSLKQLFENKLNLDFDSIKNTISYSFLVKYYHKFSLICDQYYKSNIYKWINECYPNKFKPEDFKQIISSDGEKLDSIDEKIIHELFINQFDNVKYYNSNTSSINKWHNELEDENYVADWLINDNIIVEYFGWYNMSSYNKNKIFTEYINKANRKIKYFNNLSDYYFIDLYPKDLRNNLIGVKNKINKFISKVS